MWVFACSPFACHVSIPTACSPASLIELNVFSFCRACLFISLEASLLNIMDLFKNLYLIFHDIPSYPINHLNPAWTLQATQIIPNLLENRTHRPKTVQDGVFEAGEIIFAPEDGAQLIIVISGQVGLSAGCVFVSYLGYCPVCLVYTCILILDYWFDWIGGQLLDILDLICSAVIVVLICWSLLVGLGLV